MKLIRDVFTPIFTLGRLYDGDTQVCWTCEDTVRGDGDPLTVTEWKIPTMTAIPYGAYALGLSFSNRFQKVLPQIYDVPGFAGIRMHGGNTSKDTEGCILLGLSRTSDGVKNCAPALEEVINRLGNKMATITIMRE